jgi:hypothetical protein
MLLEMILLCLLLFVVGFCIWQVRQVRYARKIVARLLMDELVYQKMRGHFLHRRIDTMNSAAHLRSLPELRKRAQEDAWKIALHCHLEGERKQNWRMKNS